MDQLLSLEPGMLIWTFLTFGLLLFLLKKIGWKPLLGALENREESIRGDLQKAEDARGEAERLLAEHRALLQHSEAEARGIIEQARGAAEAMKQSIVDTAHEQARQMTEQAKAEIQREKETALSQLRSEVADLAVQAAGKLLDEDLDDERHRKLVERYIAEFPRN